jgi:hypothetical protein
VKPERETYMLFLQALPDPGGAPAMVRRLLKFAGRVCRLRCKSVLPVADDKWRLIPVKPQNELR